MAMKGNPFERFEQLFERMSRQFDESSGPWDMEMFQRMSGMGIDIEDRGDEFVVTADAPGFSSDEIDVRIVDDRLHIRAEREETSAEEEGTYIRSERQRQSMNRTVSLPEPVDEESVSAKCKNGVLTITLPKLEPTQEARRIDIE